MAEDLAVQLDLVLEAFDLEVLGVHVPDLEADVHPRAR